MHNPGDVHFNTAVPHLDKQTPMIQATLFFLLLAVIGCGSQSPPKAGFELVELDGGELASLLELNCAKYTYSGPEMWCHWRLTAKHFGPDDKLLDETYLGGGGTGLRPGASFFCSIPVDNGGTAAIRFPGMSTNTDIEQLLPDRQVSASSGWNPKVVLNVDEPMTLAVFTVDTKSSPGYPSHEIPRGLGGHVVAITLQLREAKPGSSAPWAEPADARELPN